jgi:hypothetical protein
MTQSIIYHAADILATIFESFCYFYMISSYVDHKKNAVKIIVIYGVFTILVRIMTLSPVMPIIIKTMLLPVILVLLYRLFYSADMTSVGLISLLFALIMADVESLLISIFRLLSVEIFIEVDGIVWAALWLNLVAHVCMFAVAYIVRSTVLNRYFKITALTNKIVLIVVLYVMLAIVGYFISASDDIETSFLAFIGLSIILFWVIISTQKQIMLQMEKDQQKQEYNILKQQYSYYQDKQRDEERDATSTMT